MDSFASDEILVERCLAREAGAWEAFVDRFLPIVYRVIQHTLHTRDLLRQHVDIEDVAADVMAAIISDDFRILRNYRGTARLRTYLSVVTRRVVLRELQRTMKERRGQRHLEQTQTRELAAESRHAESDEGVQEVLGRVSRADSKLLRMFYIERRPYREISEKLGIPLNSLGPRLARLRSKLRRASAV